MDKIFHKVPFLRITAALALGIILGPALQIDSHFLLISLIFFIGLLIWINHFYSYKSAIVFGIGVHLILIITGVVIYRQNNRRQVFPKADQFMAIVTEKMQEKTNSYQTVLKITAFFDGVNINPVNEKMIALFAKNQDSASLEPGQTIIFKRTPLPIRNNMNPYEFDYQKYLSRKNIFRQIYLPENSWVILNVTNVYNLQIMAERIRIRFLNIFSRQNFNETELNVLSALTLGYKKGLDPDIKRTFASAGAMHVLAVSGLHVGIIYYILILLFGFLKKQEAGRSFMVILVVIVLWFFAFITGLSPSVQRAAVMFTFVVVGQNLKRQSNIYNTLSASAFFILLVNPNNLFEAGFQLSYSAVFGIVFLQPKFEKLLKVQNRFIKYIWILLTVSVAAQIATFPFTAVYFNQFPVYFWLSNLVVIPAVTVLIPLGLFLLFFSWIPVISSLSAAAAGAILTHVIYFLEWVERFPVSVIRICFSSHEMIIVLCFLILLFLFLEKRQLWHLKGIYICIFLFLITSLGVRSMHSLQREIIIYNYPRQIIVHLVSGRKNYIISEKKVTDDIHLNNIIQNTVIHLRLNTPLFLSSDDYFEDTNLFLKHGLLCFHGQVIKYNSKKFEEKYPFIPDIILESSSIDTINQPQISGVIVTLKGINGIQTEDIYILEKDGAYRQKLNF